MGCGASVDSGGGGSGKLDFTGMTTLPTDAFQRSGIQELVIRQCRLLGDRHYMLLKRSAEGSPPTMIDSMSKQRSSSSFS